MDACAHARRWRTRCLDGPAEFLPWRSDSPTVPRTTARAPSVRSIAVLPFEDLSAGPGDARYADGLTELLIAELSMVAGFDKVIGRQSVARFRASPVDDLAILYMNSPLFDSVRHDAAFRRLQRRMNYPALAEGDGRITPPSP